MFLYMRRYVPAVTGFWNDRGVVRVGGREQEGGTRMPTLRHGNGSFDVFICTTDIFAG